MQAKTFGVAVAASAILTAAAIAPSHANPPPSAPLILGVPAPNGGAIIGGQFHGYGGTITHQPLGSGYNTNGFDLGTPDGTTFGGTVTTAPNGSAIGGGVRFGTTF
jgi:opacity protein-like surface antigen